MQRRPWHAKTKARIVLQGWQGQPVAELGNAYQRRQALSDQWRDQFLAHADKAFEVPQHARNAVPLERENATLKGRVGDLLLALQTSDALLG
jgi:transposase-like protein